VGLVFPTPLSLNQLSHQSTTGLCKYDKISGTCSGWITSKIQRHHSWSIIKLTYTCFPNFSHDFLVHLIDRQVMTASPLQKVVEVKKTTRRVSEMRVFSARCTIYCISRLCYDVSVRLSVTEVHWVAVLPGTQRLR